MLSNKYYDRETFYNNFDEGLRVSLCVRFCSKFTEIPHNLPNLKYLYITDNYMTMTESCRTEFPIIKDLISLELKNVGNIIKLHNYPELTYLTLCNNDYIEKLPYYPKLTHLQIEHTNIVKIPYYPKLIHLRIEHNKNIIKIPYYNNLKYLKYTYNTLISNKNKYYN